MNNLTYFIHIPKNDGMSIKRTLRDIPDIEYRGHLGNNKIPSGNVDTIVVIRDPVDRFCSAVRFAIQKYSGRPNIKKLISLDITTPEQFAYILSDPDHEHYSFVAAEVMNKHHRIGKDRLKYKQTYAPQHLWINDPTYVILFTNLEEEFKLLLNSLGHEGVLLPKRNQTSKHINEFSSTADHLTGIEIAKFFHEEYREDFALLDKYNNMSVQERLKLT